MDGRSELLIAIIDESMTAIEYRDFRSDLHVRQLGQDMIRVANCWQGVPIIVKIFSNRLRRVALIRIHEREPDIVFIALADALNHGRVATGDRTIAAQKDQDYDFAGRRR